MNQRSKKLLFGVLSVPLGILICVAAIVALMAVVSIVGFIFGLIVEGIMGFTQEQFTVGIIIIASIVIVAMFAKGVYDWLVDKFL